MQLSNSSLSIFDSCPRCFFLDKNNDVPRPRGIFSSLPAGIDGLLKQQMDAKRGTLPAILHRPELDGFVLFDDASLMKKYRNWKSSPLKHTDSGNVCVGALDDLLYHPKNDAYVMLDFKTKGSEPDQAYCEKYYQKQVDMYEFLLQCGGLKTLGFGVLLYFYPIAAHAAQGLDDSYDLEFESQSFILKANPSQAKDLFDRAIKCLKSAIVPPAGVGCEFCRFVRDRSSVMS